jgi:hypothetical protein
MNRSKIILIASAAVFLILVGLAGVFAGKQHAAAAKARKGRDREFKDLEAVFRDEIFPSATNVATLGDNVLRLTEARDSFESALSAMNVPAPTNVSESVFMQTLQDLVVRKAKAAPLVEGKRCVSPDFAFGFERYVGSSSRMPRKDEVPRLVQQLRIVVSLVDEMYAANVLHINSIVREVFEEGGEVSSSEEDDSGGRPRGRSRSRRGARGGGEEEAESGGKALLAPITTDLYSGQHFVLRFTARQDSVIDLLNRIAKLRYFVVVTDVRMNKVGPDVRLPVVKGENEERRPSRRGGADRSAEVVQDADAMPVLSDLPPARRLMSGPDVDPPLDVTIELDVFHFAREEE